MLADTRRQGENKLQQRFFAVHAKPKSWLLMGCVLGDGSPILSEDIEVVQEQSGFFSADSWCPLMATLLVIRAEKFASPQYLCMFMQPDGARSIGVLWGSILVRKLQQSGRHAYLI